MWLFMSPITENITQCLKSLVRFKILDVEFHSVNYVGKLKTDPHPRIETQMSISSKQDTQDYHALWLKTVEDDEDLI